MRLWIFRATVTLLAWIFVLRMMTMGELWGPRLLKSWPSCNTPNVYADANLSHVPPKVILPSKRVYESNGYLLVSCNGGLNQMRAAICDMVTVARYLNATLIVPELDKNSFWADSSEFQDIFDVNHFMQSLSNEVRILKELPPRLKVGPEKFFSLSPVSWSNISYYHHQIEALGRKVVKILRQKGPYLALHLRYEMDMLSFSGCTKGCNLKEVKQLTKMRYANPAWKEKVIDSDIKRKNGSCPLTPEETALVLSAIGIDRNVQIYIASGKIYGGLRRMASLAAAFPNLVRKETLLKRSDMGFLRNHSSQMAALDYLVSVESDVFVPTYDGNMAKVVEGHRRYLGYKKTILFNRKLVVDLIDRYQNGSLSWDEFSSTVKEAHANRMGSPKERVAVLNKPKDEDYFYANPQECLPPLDKALTV